METKSGPQTEMYEPPAIVARQELVALNTGSNSKPKGN